MNAIPTNKTELPPLGELLTTLSFSKAEAWAFVAIGAALVGIGPIGYYFARQNLNSAIGPLLMLIPPAFGLIIIGLGVFKVRLARFAFHIHKNGIRRESAEKSDALPYDEILSVTYMAREVHRAGTVDTHERLVLQPISGTPFKLWNRHGRAIGVDQTKIRIARDLASESVAARLNHEVNSGSSVTWAAGVQIALHGIHTKKGEALSWGDVTMTQGNGVLKLRSGASNSVIGLLPCKAPNFFPCYLLARRFQNGADDAPSPSA